MLEKCIVVGYVKWEGALVEEDGRNNFFECFH